MYYSEEKGLSFDRSFESSYSRVQQIKDIYDDRISSISKQVQTFFAELPKDEIFKAMQENSLSQEYASQRAHELFTEIMHNEQETTITKLQNDLFEAKSSHLKFEYERQKHREIVKELEEKLRRCEVDKEKLLHEYDNVAGRLTEAEETFAEELNRKDIEYKAKLDAGLRKMEAGVLEAEQKYYVAKKELENVSSSKRPGELFQNEIESLKKELKSQEGFSYRQLDEQKRIFELKIEEINERLLESNRIHEETLTEFKEYKIKSEELAANHQSVIKNFVEKSKALKQKILSQKSRLQDHSKLSKESSIMLENAKSSYEKAIIDLEDRIKLIEKENAIRESELVTKHQLQITQLQQHYQQMMDARLGEMQKEVDLQIARSQEHDREVKMLMDLKMKELDREYIHKSHHEKTLIDKEHSIIKKHSSKISEILTENNSAQEDLKQQILNLRKENEELNEALENSQKAEESLKREITRERERLTSELNSRLNKLKEAEGSRSEVIRQLESARTELVEANEAIEEEKQERIKCENELRNLNAVINDLKSTVAVGKQDMKKNKSQYEQILLEKVDKSEYSKVKERAEDLEREVLKLEEEVESLQNSLKESKANRSSDLNLLELEQTRHSETKNQLKEIESYSQKLVREIEYRDNRQNELKTAIDTFKDEARNLAIALESKDKELFNLKQAAYNKELDLKGKLRISLDRIRKYVKNSVFFLQKQLHGLIELFEHERGSINKSFSTAMQEISIKIIELQVHYRKQLDFKADELTNDIKNYYRSKLVQLEDYICQENIHWNDAETEGIRRSVKSLLEKKHLGQVEIKSLRDSLTSAKEQNENLYRENQKLQIRLHANNEAFDQLQREVTEEANKIKVRLEGGKERFDLSSRSNYFKG